LTSTYFIQADSGGPVKIGKTGNPEQRLKDMQTGSPVKLMIIHIINEDVESQMHRRFAKHRIHGEWFKPEGELKKYLGQHNRAKSDWKHTPPHWHNPMTAITTLEEELTKKYGGEITLINGDCAEENELLFHFVLTEWLCYQYGMTNDEQYKEYFEECEDEIITSVAYAVSDFVPLAVRCCNEDGLFIFFIEEPHQADLQPLADRLLKVMEEFDEHYQIEAFYVFVSKHGGTTEYHLVPPNDTDKTDTTPPHGLQTH